MKSIASLLKDTASKMPDRLAVRFIGSSTTYAELDQMSDRMANGLKKKGIGPGDHVALYCINSPHFMVSYFGILKTGASVVPINLLLHPEEVQYLLQDSECKALIFHEVKNEAVAAIKSSLDSVKHYIAIGKNTFPGADNFARIVSEEPGTPLLVAPDKSHDVAVILYTGGTTGLPKGAMLTHDNLLSNITSVINALELDRHEDTFITVLPMFHSFGATVGFLSPVAAGSKVVALPQFAPEATCKVIQDEKATVFLGVPTMYAMMANLPQELHYNLRTLRICISGGAAMPIPVLERFEKRYGVIIYEGDGPTECSPVTCVNPIGGRRKIGSVGIPIPGVGMKVMDDEGNEMPVGKIGEVCVKGKNVMKGYWNQPEETKAAFHGEWFRTGDLGRMDEDGYFYLVDRRKDMIIVHGINVYPRQVEEVLYKHPDVAEAAVIGIPDELHGELPKAFVSLKAGHDAKPREIIQFCRSHLGKHEIPRWVEIIPALPKSAAGKILKRELRGTEMKKRQAKK